MTRAAAIVGLLVLSGAAAWAVTASDETETPAPIATATQAPARFLESACELPEEWVTRIARGWAPGPARASDLILVPKEGDWVGTQTYTSHSGPYDFLQRVPLVFYGPGIVRSQGDIELDREVTLADLAPTHAAALRYEWTRPAQPLTEVLEVDAPAAKVIVTIVMDGLGWNVLDRWPNAWPELRRLMRSGSSVADATVGSSPSITPSIHATIGTGLTPRRHQVTSTIVRLDDGSITGAFSTKPGNSSATAADPTIALAAKTLADVIDLDSGNRAKMAMVGGGNYLLGMIGHGSSLGGADSDIAAMAKAGRWATNPSFYSLPDYLNTDVPGIAQDVEAVDRMDGRLDGKWLGHDIERDASPALAPWVTRTVIELLERERFGADAVPDLLYVNYKSPDLAGHRYNMVNPEQRDVLMSVDRGIGEIVDFLEAQVGRGRYMLSITADHGQTPTGSGWPINQTALVDDLERRFDQIDNDRSIVETTTAVTYFIDRRELKDNGVTPEELATWMVGYKLEDNVPRGRDMPRAFEDRANETLFDAVIPGGALPEVVACTRDQ